MTRHTHKAVAGPRPQADRGKLSRRFLLASGIPSALGSASASSVATLTRGFNLIATAEHPLGSPGAAASLRAMHDTGANMVALIPFLWQPDPSHPGIVRGGDMADASLAAGIAQAHAAGLRVLVKPHVWVPGSWAGKVAMASEADWQAWFRNYRAALAPIAAIARDGGAACLSVGTELAATSHRPEWADVIQHTRAAFSGPLLYVAHNAEEASRVGFWRSLDAIGASLYPSLGRDDSPQAWRQAMTTEAMALDALSTRHGRPIWVCEIGLRSATNATERPWESAEERVAPAHEALQAEVLTTWLDVLDRPAVAAVLVWRWLSDPSAGGPSDTDFTVQGKAAQRVLRSRWGGK